MRNTGLSVIFGTFALLGLSACSTLNNGGKLHDLRTFQREPEEFSVVPSKELAQPESYAHLPTPTPGGANITDATPKADAVAALGGNPALTVATSDIPGSDAALVTAATRFGTNPGIRSQLATEDAAFRKGATLFTWQVVPRNNYNHAYRNQALDGLAWLERYRQAGAQTPTAPLD